MPNHIENRLSDLEVKLAPNYKRFLECCDDKTTDYDKLAESKAVLCFLIAFLMERHSTILERRRSAAKNIAIKHIESGAFNEEEADLMRRQGLEGELESVAELVALEQSLFSDNPEMPLNRLAKSRFNMSIVIITAPVGTCFITSDAPFYFEAYDKFSVNWLYFPLSTKYAAIFFGSSRKTFHEVCSIEETTEFNRSLLSANDLWKTALCKAKRPLKLAIET